MVTVLSRPPGEWLLHEPAATMMRLGWRFAGPSYVVMGAMATLALLIGTFGGRRAALVFGVATGISLCAELLGTTVGLPFGEYHYTGLLGYRILGRVPFPIPISWFYMLVGCLTIVATRARASDDSMARWRWAAVAGLVLVAWDIAMDPAMVRTGHWVWGSGALFHRPGVPAWITAFFSRDAFYGMPLSNWLGWYLTGTLIARVMLAVVPPGVFAQRMSATRLPVFIYLVNGVMPVAICLRHGLYLAGFAGAAAMTLPAAFAFGARRSRHDDATALSRLSEGAA